MYNQRGALSTKNVFALSPILTGIGHGQLLTNSSVMKVFLNLLIRMPDLARQLTNAMCVAGNFGDNLHAIVEYEPLESVS